MSQSPRGRNEQGSSPDLIWYIDQLEEMVSNAKRVPMSRKIMVDEDEFINLLDSMRTNFPLEMREAQKLLKNREELIGDTQEQAREIIESAHKRAQLMVSEHTILAEARHMAEEELRRAEKERQEAQGRMEVYFYNQISAVRKAAIDVMGNMEVTVENVLNSLEDAEQAIGGGDRDLL